MREAQSCVACSGFLCCILFVISMILIPIGAGNKDKARAANPDADFQALGSVCNVTGVRHCWETGTTKATNDRNVDTCIDKCTL